MLYLWVVVLSEMMSHVQTCYLKAFIFVDIWWYCQHLQRGAKLFTKGRGFNWHPFEGAGMMIYDHYHAIYNHVVKWWWFRWRFFDEFHQEEQRLYHSQTVTLSTKDDSLLKTKMEMEHQHTSTCFSGRCFHILFIFTPTWGRFPFWLVFLRWVGTTNQFSLLVITSRSVDFPLVVCSLGGLATEQNSLFDAANVTGCDATNIYKFRRSCTETYFLFSN